MVSGRISADKAYRGLRVKPGHGVNPGDREHEILESIQRRPMAGRARMVDHANRERPQGEIKVGGHQASSASMIGIMTALWFGHLSGDDKVSVKPHASPVYHAIKYLTGELDRSYLTRLRALGGLQIVPSRTKDPDVADFLDGIRGARRRRPVRRRRAPVHRGARAGQLAGRPGSSPSAVTPSSTRATSSRRSPSRRCRASATSCG